MQKKRKNILCGILSTLVITTIGNLLITNGGVSAAGVPSLSVTLDSNIDALPLKPVGEMISRRNRSAVVKITCTNISDYSVSIWADNKDLFGRSTGNTVAGLTGSDGDRTLEQLTPGTWGLKWGISPTAGDNGKTSYSAIPTSSSKATASRNLIGQAGNATEYLTLDFGIAVDSTQVPDSYSGKIIVSVLGNPLTTIYDVGTMQEISDETDACANTPTPEPTATVAATSIETLAENIDGNGKVLAIPETTMFDSRDGKEYLIRKLADGKCWMAQNLALAGGTTITPADSNVSSNYTLPSSSTNGFYQSNGVTLNMYNGTHKDAQYDNATDNTGGYYAWAVANTSTITSGTSEYDICPKNWHLPTSESEDAGDFPGLWIAYGKNEANMKEAFRPGYGGVMYQARNADNNVLVEWWANSFKMLMQITKTVYYNEPIVNPHRSTYASTGNNIRCVAR